MGEREELVAKLRQVHAYLNGDGSLEGFWFGEAMDQDARPTFWWRKELGALTQAADLLESLGTNGAKQEKPDA